MTVVIALAFRFCKIGPYTAYYRRGFYERQTANERTPLLLHKDDDASSLGSSYDSVSHDEEEQEALISVNEEENSHNLCRLCVTCYDAPRECFFLPCGHCAACFSCGKRFVNIMFTNFLFYVIIVVLMLKVVSNISNFRKKSCAYVSKHDMLLLSLESAYNNFFLFGP